MLEYKKMYVWLKWKEWMEEPMNEIEYIWINEMQYLWMKYK